MYVPSPELQGRFLSLLEHHISGLRIHGARATGLCPFHDEKTPSLSINIEKGVFHCFGCGAQGGVKRFAELVGEPWPSSSLNRRERQQLVVTLRRREAEKQARVILTRRTEAHFDAVWAKWRDANTEAAQAAELLARFHQRPDLEAELSDLAEKVERDYGESIHRRVLFEAQLAGEVV